MLHPTRGETFSDSSSNRSEGAVMAEEGVPETPVAPTASARKAVGPTPWYRKRYVYLIAAVLVLCGIAGIVVALLMGTNIITGSSSSSYAAAAAASVPVISTAAPSEPPPTLGPTQLSSSVPTSMPSLRPTLYPTAAPSISTPAPTTSSPTSQPTEQTNLDTFAFYVMGDVPYADWEADILMDQMAYMRNTRVPHSVFTVHVGDLMRPSTSNCVESAFENVANILLQGPLPTFVMQGDNDSQDCPDWRQAESYYHKYFVNDMPFENRWMNRLPANVEKLSVQRWTDKHPGLFSFVKNGILFVSVRILRGRPSGNPDGKRDDWDTRIDDSIAWFTTIFNQAMLSSTEIRGVVIFGHAFRNEETRPFFEGIANTFVPRYLDLPVLYMHGDGHAWKVNTQFSDQTGWSLFADVQVEQGALADPLLVEVAPMVDGQMVPLQRESGKQVVLGNGLFRIDQQRGSYN